MLCNDTAGGIHYVVPPVPHGDILGCPRRPTMGINAIYKQAVANYVAIDTVRQK